MASRNRGRTATMYKLEDDTLSHDAMGPPPIAPPSFCMGGASLFSTADDYLAFARMLLGAVRSMVCECCPKSLCG